MTDFFSVFLEVSDSEALVCPIGVPKPESREGEAPAEPQSLSDVATVLLAEATSPAAGSGLTALTPATEVGSVEEVDALSTGKMPIPRDADASELDAKRSLSSSLSAICSSVEIKKS